MEPAVSDVDVLGCPGDDESGSLDSCCAEVWAHVVVDAALKLLLETKA